MTIIAAGAILNSALYFIGLFVAGLALGKPTAVILALCGVGGCYFSYMAQALFPAATSANIAILGLIIAIGIGGLSVLVFGG